MTKNLGPRVALVDYTGTVSATELKKVARALARQINEHYDQPPPHGWGGDCKVHTGELKPGDWLLGLFKDADEPDALGYHDVTLEGQPVMKVFPLLDAGEGVHWSVTASHELLETMADPLLARCAQAPDGRFWALEIADAVEADIYEIDGVQVSNFVLPPYFEPTPNAALKMDYLGLIKMPYEVRPGGYGQYWTGTRWKAIYTSTVRTARRARKDAGGRGARREAAKAPYEYTAELVRVVDGDTVILSLKKVFSQAIDFGFGIKDDMQLTKTSDQRFRLAKINAPEVSTPEGAAAKDELERLLRGKEILRSQEIKVVSHKPDKYGRYLADLYVDDVHINEELVARGFAVRYSGASTPKKS